MPIYSYLNPKNNEIFDELVPMSQSNQDFILPDGTICKRIIDNGNMGLIDNNAEVFQKDSDYCKKVKPKYVRFRDGHREKYNPLKHC
jgi:hypothetical protein